MKIHQSGNGWTDRQTDIAKLIVAFRNFAKSPYKSPSLTEICFIWINNLKVSGRRRSPVRIKYSFDRREPRGRTATAHNPALRNQTLQKSRSAFFNSPHYLINTDPSAKIAKPNQGGDRPGRGFETVLPLYHPVM